MVRCCGAAIVAVFFWLLVGADAIATPLPPTITAAQIRELRDAEQADVWRFQYESEQRGMVTIEIGPEYALVERSGETSLYDFRLRRLISLFNEGSTFSQLSLHAIVGFARAEFSNRLGMQATALAAGLPLPVEMAPFWFTSELGLGSVPAELYGAEFVSDGTGGFELEYEGTSAVVFEPAEDEVPLGAVADLYRVMRYVLPLHPRAFLKMVASGRVPAFVEVARVRGNDLTGVKWSLARVQRARSDYPLSIDARATPERPFSERQPPDGVRGSIAHEAQELFLRDMLPTLLAAANDEVVTIKPSPTYYEIAIESALAQNELLDAAVLMSEMMIALGTSCTLPGGPCERLQEWVPQVQSDTSATNFLAAGQIEQRDRNRAIQLWEDIDRSALRHDYIIDLLLGNAYAVAQYGRATHDALEMREANARILKHFAAALRGNPYIPNVYKDIGEFYFRQFEPAIAWLFWDAGRTLSSDAVRGNLSAIDAFERVLIEEHPEFY